jgi:anti-sigma factor ChrR (cupin superfamily)
LRVRDDLTETAWVAPDQYCWTPSPEAGVERVMLDRVGDEVAVATSIVRYRSGSRFARHVHERGEEFFVLDGVFQDEHGDYPAGTYVRNPPGTSHAPFSEPGCLLFVKLRQFLPGDSAEVVIDTTSLPRAARNAVTIHPLHRFGGEEVCLLDGASGCEHTFAPVDCPREFLTLMGRATASGRQMTEGAWLRVPAGEAVTVRFERSGRLFVKSRPVL